MHQRTKYDLDLSRMADEPLVILAQECTFQPAVEALLLRYYEPTKKLIAICTRSMIVGADTEDAQQNGVFAILKAIACYDTLEIAKARGCSFRSYLHMVVTARALDYVKHLHRFARRYRRLDASTSEPVAPPTSPLTILIREEFERRLRECLDCLDTSIQTLWEELAGGKKLSAIARERGVSYDVLKRQRQRLRARVAAQLRMTADGPCCFTGAQADQA